MMNAERTNRRISIACCFLGLLVTFFSAGFYFFLREGWQIVLAFVGLGLMGFGRFADND